MTADVNRFNPNQINELLGSGQTSSAVYLVGIGGCGMSCLAHLLLDYGHAVSGSDLAANENTVSLSARGAIIHIGHAAGHLTAARPAMVAYSSAIPSNNPELVTAQQRGIPIVRRAVLLAALLSRQRGICVAGMHGKTTTTALLSFALERLNAHPSYAIGATVPQLARPARINHPPAASEQIAGAPGSALQGEDNWFVIEADESDGTLRSFQPEHAIILNVDEEHLDYYANLEAVCHEFQDFAGQTRDLLVYCADDPRLVELFSRRPRAVSFGYQAHAQYRITRPEVAAGKEVGPGRTARLSEFEIWHEQLLLGVFAIQLLGEKNISNAAAVIALLHQLGFAPEAIADALGPFRGAARRQHQLFANAQYRIYDDYAHHPREISATLRALKELGSQRLLVAFQPHRFTRTRLLRAQFARCFQAADLLWLSEIYPASEPPIAGVNGAALAEEIRSAGQTVEFIPVLDDLLPAVRSAIKPGDLVLFLGAGDISKIAHRLAAECVQRQREQIDAHFEALTARLAPTTLLKRDEPLNKRTTFRVGGNADLYVEPASEAELQQLLQYCAAEHLPFLLLGRGSNLLIRDGGVRGLVICLAHANFSRIEAQAQTLSCGAGAKLKAVVREARLIGLSGFEFLEGIPGTIGGALRMNAGAMGGSVFEVLERVRFMDFTGHIDECAGTAIPVAYRSCRFFENHIALAAVLRGQPAPLDQIDARLKAFSERRWHSQPAAPSAGCVFKNPPAIGAGRLIEELGLKGLQVGGAIVSDVHGNFIVNAGNASAEDVLSLIRLVQGRARNQRGITLETEIQIVGETPI